MISNLCFWFIFLSMLDVPLPSFEDVECPAEATKADLCIRVHFTTEVSELITLKKTQDTVYEGFVGDIANQISCVMIEGEDNSRIVCIFIINCINSVRILLIF